MISNPVGRAFAPDLNDLWPYRCPFDLPNAANQRRGFLGPAELALLGVAILG